MPPLHLDIDPSVVSQLGETLISDEVQALVELVKNAYDADATYARVVVDTTATTTEGDSFFPGRVGRITVEDDGTGMDLNDIRRGWLVIANSPKRESKRRGAVTPKYKRTPLGDKGLGRLSAQRLGEVVELFTTKAYVSQEPPGSGEGPRQADRMEGIAYRVGIDWRELTRHVALSDIPVSFHQERVTSPRRGTRVVISDLRDPSVWSGEALGQLQRKLGQVIFPFGRVRSFRVSATVNGESLDLVEISKQIRDAATSRFTFTYKDGVLRVDGAFKFTAFRPPNPGDQERFQRLLVRDRGRAFFETVASSQSLVDRTGVQYCERDPWFLTTTFRQSVDRLGGLDTVPALADDETVVERFADPGPFEGEVDTFDLGREAPRGAWRGTYTEFNDVVKEYSGIRVFRDGFAIRPYGMDGNDWLGLSANQTAGQSFYGLRPRNAIGYVVISAGDNAQLVEKTDREAFTDTAHSRNFIRLMQEAVGAANTHIQLLRRRFHDYQQRSEKEDAGVEPDAAPELVFRRIRDTVRGMGDLSRSAERLERAVAQADAAASEITQSVPGAQSDDGATAPAELRRYVSELQQIVAAGRSAAVDIRAQWERAKQLEANASVLERDLARVREDILDFAELGALGLTAEAVSHELRTVAADLALRTRHVLRHMRSVGVADETTLAYVEHVRSAVSTLRKQLAHLAPGLRYVREVSDVIAMRSFIDDLISHHRDSFARRKISFVLDEPWQDCTILMNRGKLTQVLDNLFLNSRYWLAEDLAARRIELAEIHVGLADFTLSVWDTGRGIDPSVERTLFDPFVTNKPKGRGRGLGLFIARQLLGSSGCHIDVAPDRNRAGSLYKFRIDLTGALHGR